MTRQVLEAYVHGVRGVEALKRVAAQAMRSQE